MADCNPKYLDLAQEYMDNARKRTEKDPWESLIFGVVLTMARNNAKHAEVIQSLKDQFPTPNAAAKKCEGITGTSAVPYTPEAVHRNCHSPTHVMECMCLNSSPKPTEVRRAKGKLVVNPDWEDLVKAMRTCDRQAVQKHCLFTQQKGRDMLLLESGCETPVIDRWIIRKFNPDIPPELEADFATFIGNIQRTKRYEVYREKMIAEANECGIPAGTYHVAAWFELVFGEDREQAEQYVKSLINSSK